MAKKIESVEGIGAVYGEKLRTAGCGTTAQLLKQGATRKGREVLAGKTGISPSIIMRCVNMADLFRIKGVATQYAELLEAAGVDTVKELKHRNAANLSHAMREANAARKLVRQLPAEKTVAGWIAQAKALPSVVTY
ncbi:MAG: DUF4332 domain-containing protein [Gammaproteobacteria bacterium]|nr:DUF4332 domain-containing protein [Gammaproteobacteria bacterium]